MGLEDRPLARSHFRHSWRIKHRQTYLPGRDYSASREPGSRATPAAPGTASSVALHSKVHRLVGDRLALLVCEIDVSAQVNTSSPCKENPPVCQAARFVRLTA
jgi:hypothetical protein